MHHSILIHSFRLGVFLLMLTGCYVHAQKSGSAAEWRPNVYRGIDVRDKENLFTEEFVDNSNGWNLTSPSIRMNLNGDNGGSLMVESMKSSTIYKLHSGDIPLDSREDYEIELRIRYIRSGAGAPTESETGLVFGRDNSVNSDYIFGFNAVGLLHIGQCRGGLYSNYVNWRYTPELGRITYNVLTVRKVSDQWYFFINEKLVHQQEAESLFGRKLGFLVGGFMTVEVDYLHISRLRPRDITPPVITLLEPVPVTDQRIYTTSDTVFTVRGIVSDPSGVTSVRVNTFDVVPDKNNMFSVTFRVQSTPKPVTITATDPNRNIASLTIDLQHVPLEPTPNGHNYLLVIGIDAYKNWAKLQNAVKDCQDVKSTLETYYTFDQEHTFTLFNDQASYEGILEMFEYLQKNLTDNDNLVIYYAGHGYYDQVSKLGYWVPWGARQDKVADYLRNSTIHDYLRTINTHHTLLLADACYAGSLLAADRGVINETNRSRWAFASGDLQKVYDGEPGENSPFCKFFLTYLINTPNQRVRADEMIRVVKAMVQRNAMQTPVGSPVQNVGDEGGVFVFERRPR